MIQQHPTLLSTTSTATLEKISSLRGGAMVSASLNPLQLASSLSTILLIATFLRLLRLKVQSSRILSAAARMSVQLTLMGTFVLTPLFAFASSSPWRIAGWISIVAVIASREAASRSKYTYKGQMADYSLAMFAGVGLTLLHLVTCVLHPPFSASRMNVNAQTIIPMAGMLFGNALSAATLGMSILLSNFLENGRDRVELRLSRGSNVWEAALPAVRDAVEAALMPTVNAMASTGLIFMPGMMTGQILGGQSPSAAAAYQIMIYFAIASSSCLTALFLACITTARMFDLPRQALVPWRSIPGLRSLQQQSEYEQSDDSQSYSNLKFLHKTSSLNNIKPLLRVEQLTVESTNLNVPSLEINDGDRIGISGRSGIGKTQLLRALARLDPLSPNNTTMNTEDTVFLDGQPWSNISPAYWRSQVMWVSQDRPTLSGTPREFYRQILKYRSHRLSSEHNMTKEQNPQPLPASMAPMNIAQEWNLSEKAWDQPWNDLSGGEAQRISLAIALALDPKVLLLDEPTSSCDLETTTKIENTLMERKVTVVMVSHSEEQLRRFTTSMIELS